MKKIKAALFDMDGLLVDSERLGIDVSIRAGREMGFPVTEELAREMLGITSAQSRAKYQAAFPNMDLDAFQSLFARYMERAVERGEVRAMPGAQELLAFLRSRGVPCVVASSTDKPHVLERLSRAGLDGLFDGYVTGDMVSRSKPDPEIFLRAAACAGQDIADCLVLEDSVNGIKAGRASGARVVMVPDVIPYSDALAPFCDRVEGSLLNVKKLLEENDCAL